MLSRREGEMRVSHVFAFPKGEKEKSKSALRRNRRERPTTVYPRSIIPPSHLFSNERFEFSR